ncbi:glycosyltransferase family 2 protein [Hymenobacter weizhouensis]|uniref:glycosyltransferase family 2 protein n=1 Tax=Hymenobacter sp. YIM 151500-1 TaxID=2987689 RepID=UPI0022261EA9|nr:glycosyltransferase [Hymenobacter sp. YIM 151500-1]UYZ61372.1 glycosyltransferase [Hymenobacter sp. YIM 151500-1]
MTAKVSVIIPNYNHARYLPQRIESVLNQTFTDFELLIMDDCSPDNSRDIIEKYAALDKRIRILYNEQNSGSTFKQWNKGIAHTKGEYIWLAESDDLADVNFLTTLVKCLEEKPRVGLVYCDSITIDENDTRLQEWKYTFCEALQTTLWMQDFDMDGPDFISKYMTFGNSIPNASAVLLRRSALTAAGPADENTRLAGDWLYWVSILKYSGISYISRSLNYFRTHNNNVRSQTTTNGVLLVETSQVLLKIKAIVGVNAQQKQIVLALLKRWIQGFVYGDIPGFRHRILYSNINKLLDDNGKTVKREWIRFLLGNKLSGIRMILGDKYLYKVFPSLRK